MSTVKERKSESSISQTTARSLRHILSTGMSFIDTSINNLSGTKPDRSQAKKIYDIGAAKLRSAIADLDRYSSAESEAKDLGYNGTIEEIYTSSNEQVAAWTRRFESHVHELNIFPSFENSCPVSATRAQTVGVLWHEFSSFMPWFLCQAAAMVTTNEKRHYVIQTAFEELGMRNSKEIHPDMFWEAAKSVGVDDSTRESVGKSKEAIEVLGFLKNTLLQYKTDEEILGILLGLEIPAVENIETVFRSLAHNEIALAKLEENKFFRLHRQIEIEHVRLTVSNFLRFCPNEDQQHRFVSGFFDGLKFWSNFWSTAASLNRSFIEGGIDEHTV